MHLSFRLLVLVCLLILPATAPAQTPQNDAQVQVWLLLRKFLKERTRDPVVAREAVARFQAAVPVEQTGLLTSLARQALYITTRQQLDFLDFKPLSHPRKPAAIWLPFGLSETIDTATRQDSSAVIWGAVEDGLAVQFLFVKHKDLEHLHRNLRESVRPAKGKIVHENLQKDRHEVLVALGGGKRKLLSVAQHGGGGTFVVDMIWHSEVDDMIAPVAQVIALSLELSLAGEELPSLVLPQEELTLLKKKEDVPPAQEPDIATAEAANEPAPTPPAKGTDSVGTAIFVSRDGHALTSARLALGCSQISITTGPGEASSAKLLAADRTNDLALLTTIFTDRKPLPVRTSLRLGESIAAFGYPENGASAQNGRFALGNVSSLVGPGDDSRFAEVSIAVQSGGNGGPLLDAHGNLVGMQTATEDVAALLASREVEVPAGINLAKRMALVIGFLEGNRIAPARGNTSGAKLEPADIAERARTASASLRCVR